MPKTIQEEVRKESLILQSPKVKYYSQRDIYL